MFYMVEYTIANYIDDNDKEPIIDWLKSLDGSTKKRILLRFDRVLKVLKELGYTLKVA